MMYDQGAIIDKINEYLKFNKRKLVLGHGYCHGLTLLWLYKMSEKKEQWFYDTLKKIVDTPTEKLFEIEMDIEKFLAHIEWLQQPEKYVPTIRQMDTDSSMEVPKELPISSVFNPAQLDTVLNLAILPDKMISISGPDHSIGLVFRDGKFYLYNPNYTSGEAKVLDSTLLLRYELIQCLFADFDHPTKKLAITINVMGGDDMTSEKASIRTWIMKATGVMNFCDYGLGPLYLACENHDVELVQLLLEKGALPDIPTKDNRYPMILSCYSGYVDQVELLLQYGANPNLEGREGLPLYVASKNGHEKVIKILLENGALINKPDRDGETAIFGSIRYDRKLITKLLLDSGADPLLPSKNGDTPMDIAIAKKDWGTVGMMLLYVETPHARNIKILKKYKKNIMNVLDKLIIEKVIASYESQHIIKTLKEISAEKSIPRKTTKVAEVIRRNVTEEKTTFDLNRNRFFHLIKPEMESIKNRHELISHSQVIKTWTESVS